MSGEALIYLNTLFPNLNQFVVQPSERTVDTNDSDIYSTVKFFHALLWVNFNYLEKAIIEWPT